MSKDEGQSKLLAALDIMQRMPPSKIEQSLTGLLNLIPEETDELLQRIDQPLTEHTCPKTGKKYLLCDYNRDGDSFRYVRRAIRVLRRAIARKIKEETNVSVRLQI